jgi:mRNA-degrading endonuclease YafQ of YafQ-DinJ toxin-antitoxin module
MKINYSKRFRRQFAKLDLDDQAEFWKKISWFEADPYDLRLNNHTLRHEMSHLRSINIQDDLRALFEVVEEEVYVYEMIGTHSQLYG